MEHLTKHWNTGRTMEYWQNNWNTTEQQNMWKAAEQCNNKATPKNSTNTGR